MSLLQDDHAYELLGALVAASPADETEATLECREERFVRFGPAGPAQAADRERYGLTLRVRFEAPGGGFREARATTDTLDRHELGAALQRAVTLARLAPASHDAAPLGGPVDVPGTAPERPTQDHSFREKSALVARAQARAEAEGLLVGGLVATLVANKTLVNSAGRRVHAARSRAAFAVTAVDGPAGRGGRGSAERIEANIDRIDADAVIERAVRAALAARDPSALPPSGRDDGGARRLTVVLEPRAVAALLLAADFGAEAFAQGRSFLAGRLGERMFPDLLRLTEDPTPPGCPGWVFDAEGTPVQRVELLRDGALTGPVTDARWARALGVANTGHAGAPPAPHGPRAANLVLAPGHSTTADLIAGVADGLVVAELQDVHVAEPRDVVFHGATRHGALRVQGGKVVGAVHDLCLRDSLVELLTRVTGVGASTERCSTRSEAECTVPALRVDGLRFTSASHP